MDNNFLQQLKIRNAVPEDAPVIQNLLNQFAEQRLLLPRTVEDILEKIRNFKVAEHNGVFMGCCALRNYGGSLYEVRSLAIVPEQQRKGVASSLVKSFLKELEESGEAARVFTLTYQDIFFSRLGFQVVKKDLFPQKIWSDCWICPKKDCCDEIAMLLDLNGYHQK